MKYQIRNRRGNIVDRNLSYEEALMYTDSSVGEFYTMENMEDKNRGGSKTRRDVVSGS